MNSRTIDVVTDWETVAAPDGYEGLHELADGEFSGAVSAGMTWAFFLNGRVVGVFEGDIEDFEHAELTAYRAADPSLPLLFSMRERGGETRASYYTNETPLSEADETLSNGGFTGYIELSENVLSGDYYVVYHGGKSMSAAFVGSSERLITGEEAFEKAADEVGIYEVIDADVELVEIPEPPSAAAEDDDGESPVVGDAGGEDETGDGPDEAAERGDDIESEADAPEEAEREDESESDEPEAGPDPVAEAEADDGTEAETEADAGVATAKTPGDDSSEPTARDADREDPSPRADAEEESAERDPRGPDADATAETGTTDGESETTPDRPADPASDGQRPERSQPEATADAGPDEAAVPEGPAAAGAETDQSSGGSAVFSDEERWREAKTIPSLDPSASSGNGTTGGTGGEESERRSARERVARMQRDRSARKAARERAGSASQTSASPAKASARESSPAAGEGIERLKKRLSRARDRVESLEAEREELAAERDELESERAERDQRIEELQAEREEHRERIEELEAERDALEAEVERLESELEAVSSDGEVAGEATMSPEQALSGTNLFVRYDRKGEATLEHAHDGEATREDVSGNLRLEHHTTFETDGLVVDGRPYAEFLHDSTEYSFAHWLVTDLLYEIGQTGNRSGLAGVFDAIPDVDRIELYGTVGVETDEGVEQRDFDVIFRDKMGDPLFVADINASRNATTEAMVDSLVTNTGTIAAEDDSLAAGFYVTESFYEPGALETVAEETGGGLLSRSSKLSYVKLSRKRGYHLCLAEARNGEFHLNVPDL
ncbi:DUF7527 domain-containing protein [Halobellus limi]|uniref:DUF7527 domain-containing protein n=1 Tax=Halobellus limi TaxID=699433 RepID=A0A1H5ZQX3_9EURY|nr:hypothetical protein [Halobellus limi]QCC47996.1 hypothetical protein DV707_10190 [Halobellus limi]SEG38394.1 hypothetical protein SAMN04488133_2116 [Halobellus limi]